MTSKEQKQTPSLKILGFLLAGLIGAEIFFVHLDHPYFSWYGFKGYSAILSFFAAPLLILGAKAIGKLFLYRDENYYEREDAS